MTFSIDQAFEILGRTPGVYESLLSGLSDEWTRNNEGPETWSPYNIVAHLIAGEKTDWIPRAKIILSDSENKTFEPFDMEAHFKTDQSIPIEDLLAEFKSLRKECLEELKAMQIDEKKMAETGIHPELGEANLKELLSTWVVHDLGHIAQVSRVMAKQYKTEVGPWSKFLGILKR